MATPVLPFIVALISGSPVQVDLQAPPSNIFLAAKQRQVLLIAQKYDGADPKGADPHGPDPNDENHDPGLPANQEQKAHKAPKDVYGGSVPNGQQPY